jgi:competence protein ComEA
MTPIRSFVDDIVSRVRHHILFVGPRRVVVGALTVGVLVLAGWLLFAPAPPSVESVLPPAGSSLVARSTVPAGTVAGGTVRVHVAGAVRRPGVYEVPADGRIIDAVRAAGGASSSADLDAINLAQTLRDTEQVYVPTHTRTSPRPSPRTAPRLRPTTVPPAVSPAPAGSTTLPSTEPTAPAAKKTVNVNQATASQLEELPGVGEVTARRIISWRQSKGPFATAEDLMKVEGIGPAKFAAMKPFVSV